MPYIPQNRRVELLNSHAPLVAGELNFLITNYILQTPNALCAGDQIMCWIKAYWQKKPCYQTANDIMGALECAGLELLRRNPTGRKILSKMQVLTQLKSAFYCEVVGPYEDTAITRNGDLDAYLNQKEVDDA